MSSPADAIGGYAWSEARHGRLTTREKLRMLGLLLRAQLAESLETLAVRLGPKRHVLERVDLSRVPLPHSAMVEASVQEAEAQFSPVLLRHLYRTYSFATLVAQVDRVRFDPELLFVSSMLHDLGIAPAHADEARRCCFAVSGARKAKAFVEARGWDEDRGRCVYEAISLHLNPYLDRTRVSAEACLLAAGATMDVLGSRHAVLPAAAKAEVERQYPRAGFREEIGATIRDIEHMPNGRPHFLRRLGFGFLAARNPLDRAHAQGEAAR